MSGHAGADHRDVTIVEVGPRDGFQPIGPFIPTSTKVDYIRRLFDAGLHRIEVGSFVSPQAIPQLRDTAEILNAIRQMEDFDAQVLAPSERRARDALAAGARHVGFFLSVSEAHNRNNVRRHPHESVAEYEQMLEIVPQNVKVRLSLATSFDCPFDGKVPVQATLDILQRTVKLREDAEICLCDTTGRATPDHVADLFSQARRLFGADRKWAFHGHDTYGMGLVNVYAAYQEGVRVFDASFAGLGGCPFAPGATGNVATEDVVWMFEKMGVSTGVDLAMLIEIAGDGALIPGGMPGGRAREAFRSSKLCS